MILKYVEVSRRYVPELLAFMQGVLRCTLPMTGDADDKWSVRTGATGSFAPNTRPLYITQAEKVRSSITVYEVFCILVDDVGHCTRD